MLTSFDQNLESLCTGAGILCLLAVLSVWVWALIIVMACNLRTAAKTGEDSFMGRHTRFCKQLAQTGLRAKLQKRIANAHSEGALRQAVGSVSTVLLLSSIAPLLGLLGTVQGMIETFQALAFSGSADSAALTAGISQALVTTQGGLLVAIPSLLAGGLLHRRARKLRDALDTVALRASSNKVQPVIQGGAA